MSRLNEYSVGFRNSEDGRINCYDWLLIYFAEDDILTLTLVDTGVHVDLLNMQGE